ncbi:nucleolar protein 58-like [Chironomus tepperi]|uniref:nucleolar protein 58-like n=1 Tax=Chironomus tepperi TaxID=113505 RepID=UPI00391F9C18
MEPIKAEEPKSMSQKRQRDDKNEATNESETEVTEKRAKIEQVPLMAPETSKIEEPAIAEMEVEKDADNKNEKIQEISSENENLDENLAAEVKIEEDQHAVEVTNDEKTGHEVVAENCDVITLLPKR